MASLAEFLSSLDKLVDSRPGQAPKASPDDSDEVREGVLDLRDRILKSNVGGELSPAARRLQDEYNQAFFPPITVLGTIDNPEGITSTLEQGVETKHPVLEAFILK